MKVIKNNKPRFITLLEDALSVMDDSLIIGDAERTTRVRMSIKEFLDDKR